VQGETIDGRPISLSDYAGKVVVVNVWGSWCAPCRAEAPLLASASRHLAERGVEFLGINSRDLNQAAARAFDRRYDVPYPSIYDQQGRTLLAFRGTLPPNSIPSTVIIDRKGRVAASVLGQITRGTLYGLVEDVSHGTAGRMDGGA
jgi:thiol-disulfide isomerase/thioredoxin